MSYGQVVKCLLQHQDCFGEIVNIQVVRGLKRSFLVTVDPLNRNALLGETLTILFVLVYKDGCLDSTVLKDSLRFVRHWYPSLFFGPSGMPLWHYLMGANAIFVSQPQPFLFAKAGCAW